jgi:hypothetical protein
MRTLTVPNPVDAITAITEHLTMLPHGRVNATRREQIIKNSLRPVALLIEAVKLAGAAGAEEEAVLIQFIRTLYAQSEQVKREYNFASLTAKLSARRSQQLKY